MKAKRLILVSFLALLTVTLSSSVFASAVQDFVPEGWFGSCSGDAGSAMRLKFWWTENGAKVGKEKVVRLDCGEGGEGFEDSLPKMPAGANDYHIRVGLKGMPDEWSFTLFVDGGASPSVSFSSAGIQGGAEIQDFVPTGWAGGCGGDPKSRMRIIFYWTYFGTKVGEQAVQKLDCGEGEGFEEALPKAPEGANDYHIRIDLKGMPDEWGFGL